MGSNGTKFTLTHLLQTSLELVKPLPIEMSLLDIISAKLKMEVYSNSYES